jgi:hypothetical protein
MPFNDHCRTAYGHVLVAFASLTLCSSTAATNMPEGADEMRTVGFLFTATAVDGS